MVDIVERLRGNNQRAYFGDGAIMYDAANEIERLRAALARIATEADENAGACQDVFDLGEIARAALSPSPPIPKPSRSNRDKTQRHRSAFAAPCPSKPPGDKS